MIKIDDEFFVAWADDGKVEIDVYRVRSIRGRWVFLNQKIDGVTWGKRSSKNGDYGWIGKVPDYWRKRFLLADGLPARYGRTKAAAIRGALAACRKSLQRGGDADVKAEIEADIKTLTTRLKALVSRAPK